jgi:hypothetical protein
MTTTTKIPDFIQLAEGIEDIINQRLEEGFVFYASKYRHDPTCQFLSYKTPDNTFGYIQWGRRGLIDLSSQYKPSRENGTGAVYRQMMGTPTREDFERAARKRIGDVPVKWYKDEQDFIKRKERFVKIIKICSK